MNTYSIMGYSLNRPNPICDNNNLPYAKLDAELNNGKTFCYPRPLQSRLIDSQYKNIDFKNKKEVLVWAKKNMKLCNYFSINKIKDIDWHFNFLLLHMSIKNEYSGDRI